MNEEERIEQALEQLNLDPIDKGRYWLIRCPTHDDGIRSAQCFKDGWIHCHAGCPRKHINNLVGTEIVQYRKTSDTNGRDSDLLQHQEIQTGSQDYTDFWLSLEPIDTDVKGVDVRVLRRLGWKRFEGCQGYSEGILIPYFNVRRDRVPFFQIRHPEGSERRFTFARGARPIAYGLECLPQMDGWFVFTEGSRDSAILRSCGIPAVGIPSASSVTLLRQFENYCRRKGLILVCCGDNDEAGSRLIKNINMPFIDARTPIGKDVGDLYEQYGREGVLTYYGKYRSNKADFNQDEKNASEAIEPSSSQDSNQSN